MKQYKIQMADRALTWFIKALGGSNSFIRGLPFEVKNLQYSTEIIAAIQEVCNGVAGKARKKLQQRSVADEIFGKGKSLFRKNLQTYANASVNERNKTPNLFRGLDKRIIKS